MKLLFIALLSMISVNSFATATHYSCTNARTILSVTMTGKNAKVTLKSPVKKSLDCTLNGQLFKDDVNKVIFANFVCWDSNSNDSSLGNVILAVNSIHRGGIYLSDFEDSELECTLNL